MSSSSETNGRRAECRSGTQTAKTDNQTGRSYALIPLVGITPNSIVYSNANACIYTFHEAVDYQPLRLPSYSYSYYLFTIILTDYSNTMYAVCFLEWTVNREKRGNPPDGIWLGRSMQGLWSMQISIMKRGRHLCSRQWKNVEREPLQSHWRQ